MSIILGLDPGSQIAGFGIIQKNATHSKLLSSGVIMLPSQKPLGIRLKILHDELEKIYQTFRPQDVVIEKIFFGRNADSAFKLGHVRGVCMMQAFQHGAAVHEYAARKIKKVITGTGAATKEHMQYVVSQIIGKKLEGPFDEADAIAIALCHIQEAETQKKIKKNLEAQL
ncbi:MAG: crossover junction endodeoxyribonuclease RuvC [Bdellovibrionales bacterium]|nr:crossover junction endodeoxyribonuclease RuvC [Bdellovibrionales bacterium]